MTNVRSVSPRRLASVAAALAAGFIGVFSPGLASGFVSGSWMPAGDLSVLGVNSSPQLAVAPDGSMAAVWSRFDGTKNVVQASTRGPGGDIDDAVDLSSLDPGAAFPDVVVAADGAVTAVWSGPSDIRASTRPPGGTFGAPVTIGVGKPLASPQAAVAPDGTVIVAWVGSNGTHDIVRASVRPPGGAFGAPVDLSAAGQNAQSPHAAFATDGAAVVTWARSDGANLIVQASTRPAGGTFGIPTDLSAAGQNATEPQLAVAADGTATAIWTRADVVQTATRPLAGAFGAPVELSSPGQITSPPRIAVAGDGSVTAIWALRPLGQSAIVETRTRPAGGAFGPPVPLTVNGTDAHAPQIAASNDGTTTAVWTRSDGANERVQASTRAPGGSFGPASDLSAPGQSSSDPQVAQAANGYASVIWKRSDGGQSTIQATFSGDPPIRRALPAISGTPALGSALSCDGGRWIGATSVETRWLRGGAEVGTGPSYPVAAADQGSSLTCSARAGNAFGSTDRLSASLAIPAAVAVPPPPPAPFVDRAAPRLNIVTRARITSKQFRSGVSVTLSADEPTRIVAELRLRAGDGAFRRVVGSRTLIGVMKSVTVRIKPNKKLIGKKARALTVRLRITASDAAGNRRITGKTIKVLR